MNLGRSAGGAVGMIEGRIVALLTGRMGIANAAAAVTDPYVLPFLREQLRI